MKMLKRTKKVVIACSMLVFALIAVIATNGIDKVSAASKGYFNEYKKLTTIEHGDNYCGIQGMSVYGDWAYYAKLQVIGKVETGKCGIWAYNLKTGDRIKVYNGEGNNAVFNVGHANCLFVNSQHMYIAAGDVNMGVIRYDLEHQGDRVNLTNKQSFALYTGKNKSGKKVAASGVEYAGALDSFLVKSGDYIYSGNFKDGYFAHNETYKIQLSVKCKDETLNLESEKVFRRQSMYYDDGILYLPMSRINPEKQSIVVGFHLRANNRDGDILDSVDDSIVRITSNNAYPHRFEAEAVDNYNGKMIMAVNALKDDNGHAKAEDILVEIKDFRF